MTTSPAAAAPAVLSPWRIALFGLLPFGLGYFLSYLFRAVNAIVAPELVRELSLDAAQLGFLTAAYLLAFSLFQLPLGVLLDRYGPRRVQAGLLSVAAVGALLFSFGQNMLTLTLARALIGLGFAGGLMSSFKAVVVFVPEPRRGLASACVMSLGALGLMASTSPMQVMVSAYGWRAVFFGLAVLTALVAALIFLTVPKPDATTKPQPLSEQMSVLWRIMRDPAFLRLAPLLGASAGTHIAIQTLWAGLWWRDIGRLDAMGVANSLLLMSFAFFVGILATGYVADFFKQRGVNTLDVLLGFMIAFFSAQALIIFDVVRMPAWMLFGMFGQVAVLAFPWLSSYFGAALSGRANSAMNLFIFSIAFAAQWAIGAIIDQFPRTASGGFPLAAYQTGFGAFLALEVVGLLWYLPARKRLISGRKAETTA
jgi:predicted MFS family arabinose efflux permease